MFVTFCLRITGVQNVCFSIAFIFWLAFFASQHTKSIDKHKLLELTAPKQVKIEMPRRNRKSVNLRAFSHNSISLSHEDTIFPIFGFAYKQ